MGTLSKEDQLVEVLTSTLEKHASLVFKLFSEIYILSGINHRIETRKTIRHRVLKLDEDISTLEANMSTFENQASDTSRLTDRKNSTHLLREEDFRKKSRQRFHRFLEKLRSQLYQWEKMEGTAFVKTHPSLLSENTSRLLQEKENKNWVEDRTELMHLHTASKTGPTNSDAEQRKSSGSGNASASPTTLSLDTDNADSKSQYDGKQIWGKSPNADGGKTTISKGGLMRFQALKEKSTAQDSELVIQEDPSLNE